MIRINFQYVDGRYSHKRCIGLKLAILGVSQRKRYMNMIRNTIWQSATVAIAASLILTGCGGEAEQVSTEQAASLRTQDVSRGEIARIINASGKVNPETTVQVGSEVSGRILQINADFNDPVTEGQILAVIDPETFENRVAQSLAAYQNAQAQIRIREASVERAQINLDQTKAEGARIRNLFNSNAASQQRLEEIERDIGLAQSDVALNQAQLDGAKSSLRQSEASLKTARVDLARTIIRSPIDGIVIERKVDAGQTVQASFSAPELFLIANDLSVVQVEAAIVESDVAGLGAGDAVTFTVDAYPTTRFQGNVDVLRLNSKEVSNIVTYTAVVSASNPDGFLMPGMTANLQIVTESKQGVLRVPAAAERFRPSPDVIEQWQAEGGAASEDKIEDWVTITGNLKKMSFSDTRINAIKSALNAATESIRGDLANPEEGFRRTPNLKKLSEQSRVVIESELSPTELQAYRQLEQEASTIRSVDLWIANAEGKMVKRTVGLGVSDGAFVEVLSGLAEGDKVVIGVGGPQQAGRPGGGRPGGGRPR